MYDMVGLRLDGLSRDSETDWTSDPANAEFVAWALKIFCPATGASPRDRLLEVEDIQDHCGIMAVRPKGREPMAGDPAYIRPEKP